MPPDDPPMGANRNLQNGAVVRAPKGLEGLVTLRTAAVGAGQLGIFDRGGQRAVIAPAVPWPTRLLTAWSRRGSVRRCARGAWRRCRGRRCFRLAAEELLFPQTQFGFDFGEALLQLGFAFDGAPVHSPPISGFARGAELFLQQGADRTGTRRWRQRWLSRYRRVGRRSNGVLFPQEYIDGNALRSATEY